MTHMVVQKSVYLKKPGWYAFAILRDGTPFIVQEYKPFVQGFKPMTEALANRIADRLLAYFTQVERFESAEEATREADRIVRGYTVDPELA